MTALERLLDNNWSYECTDLIFKFRTKVAQSLATQTALEPQTDDAGRQFVEYIGNLALQILKLFISFKKNIKIPDQTTISLSLYSLIYN